MAKSKKNVITHNLSGKVGDLVLFTQRFGQTIVGKIPVHTGEVTADQQVTRDKFRSAAKYAKRCILNPVTREIYAQKAGGGVTAYNLAFADFFRAPQIDDIITSAYTGTVGSPIEVQATDDTRVKEVQVSIVAADGALVEQGPALLQAESDMWLYNATAANVPLAGSKIVVTAKDLPGNIAHKEKTL